jgi:hypothetical protein
MNETPRNKVQKKVVSKKRSWKGGGKKSHNAVRNQRLGFEARKETDGYTKRERVYKVSEREREREREENGDNVGGCVGGEKRFLGGTTCSELEIDRTWSVAAHCGRGKVKSQQMRVP